MGFICELYSVLCPPPRPPPAPTHACTHAHAHMWRNLGGNGEILCPLLFLFPLHFSFLPSATLYKGKIIQPTKLQVEYLKP